VRNIQKEFFPHPFAPLLKPLGITGGTESPLSARKTKKMLPAA
jgi:hypothetical protein